MNDWTAFTEVGSSQCSTTWSLVRSICTSPSLTTKYSTSIWSKVHFTSFRWRSSSCILSSTCLVLSWHSSWVLANTRNHPCKWWAVLLLSCLQRLSPWRPGRLVVSCIVQRTWPAAHRGCKEWWMQPSTCPLLWCRYYYTPIILEKYLAPFSLSMRVEMRGSRYVFLTVCSLRYQ